MHSPLTYFHLRESTQRRALLFRPVCQSVLVSPSFLSSAAASSFFSRRRARRRPHRVAPGKKDDGPIRKDERNAHADAFDLKPQFSLHHSPLETQIYQEMLQY